PGALHRHRATPRRHRRGRAHARTRLHHHHAQEVTMGDSIARRADALRDLADSDIKRLRENPEPFPIPCPRCKAPRGEPCVSSMGNYTHTHTPRRNKAEAMGLAIAITAPDVHGTPAHEADQPAEWGIECPYCRAPEGKPCRDRHG